MNTKVTIRDRRTYAERLEAGRAIGSGQVEGEARLWACAGNAAARWNRRNVQPIASLVCLRHTGQWASYWASAA